MSEHAVEPGTVELLDLFDQLTPPCDFADDEGCEAPAKWVMHRAPHGCGWLPPALACDGCKTIRLSSDEALECSHCDYVEAPARSFYSHVEAL